MFCAATARRFSGHGRSVSREGTTMTSATPPRVRDVRRACIGCLTALLAPRPILSADPSDEGRPGTDRRQHAERLHRHAGRRADRGVRR